MHQVRNSAYKSRVEKYLERQHFMKHVGITLDVIEPGKTEASLKVLEIHKQQKGLLHGGVIATLADIVAGFAAYTLVPEDYNVVTGEIKISYLRPGTSDQIYAKGWVLKSGSKLNFCEAEVWQHTDGGDELLAKASASMITLPPR
jgi:uncharacterized protein (TIGR00369 family)